MSAPIVPIDGIATSISGIQPLPAAAPTEAVSGTAPSSFAKALESVSALESEANTLAQQLATGQLVNIHDFTTAAAKASLAVELTAAIRNRAVEAYNEIMRMQV